MSATVAERARRLWANAEQAQSALDRIAGMLGIISSIHLGVNLPEDLVIELARISGGDLEFYRARGDDSIERVYCDWSKRRLQVEVFGSSSRPATAADAHLPLRGGRS